MHEHQNDNHHDYDTVKSKPVELKKDYRFFNQNIFFRALSFFVVILMKIFVQFFYSYIFLGFRVKGKKHFRKAKKGKGMIIVSNHMHVFDAILIGTSVFPKKLYVTMLKSNLGLPYVGKILRVAGGVPIPDNKEGMARMITEIRQELHKGNHILVMPEAAIRPYHVGIRRFMNGAFRFAIDSNARIQPVVYIYKKPRFLMKWLKKKPYIQLHFLPVIDIIERENRYETLSHTKNVVHEAMRQYFNLHSDIKEDAS